MASFTDTNRSEANTYNPNAFFTCLFELNQEGDTSITRLTTNNEDITSNSNVFTAMPALEVGIFTLKTGEQLSTIALRNVDRIIGRILRGARGRVEIRMMVIDYDTPDTYLLDTKNIAVLGTQDIDASLCQAPVISKIDNSTSFPPVRADSARAPGLWIV